MKNICLRGCGRGMFWRVKMRLRAVGFDICLVSILKREEYAAYKARASFFNATSRTADGFVGLIFRRVPTFKIPEKSSAIGRALAAFLEDANMLGNSLPSYAKDVVREVMSVGRAGSLVDWEDEAEQRAYAVLYQTEQIINWRTERVNGRNVLTLVVLQETIFGVGEDPFEASESQQLRVLRFGRGKMSGSWRFPPFNGLVLPQPS